MQPKLSALSAILLLLWVLPVFSQGGVIDLTDMEEGRIEGELTETLFNQRYQFMARIGETYIIQMTRTSGDLDPHLFLFDEREQYIVDNDDSDAGLRDSLIRFTPAIEGVYIIEATRFQREAGNSTGTYRLTISRENPETEELEPTTDFADIPPDFGVETYDFLRYGIAHSGTINEDQPRLYFVIPGNQGDAVQLEAMTTSGDLEATVLLIHPEFFVPQILNQSLDGGRSIQSVFPQSGWYLVEVTAESGSGEFSLLASRLYAGLLNTDEPQESEFTPESTIQFFVFNATISERIFVNMIILSDEEQALEGVIPKISILDRSGEELIQRESQGSQTRASLTIPRSGPYIVRVENSGTSPSAQFRLQMRRSAPNINKLRIRQAAYNRNFRGTINDENPIEYYEFSGKAGELITLEMRPNQSGEITLDPFLILADAELNELASNDNAGATKNARITQFSLPYDGIYYILATRPRLSLGTGTGRYIMSITVGEIALRSGAFTATLNWEGDDDLNLFLRTPSGHTLSWANPLLRDGSSVQIDSNTACETPTAQPVEHIYLPDENSLPGEYTVWVWYQNVCNTPEPASFSLSITAGGNLLFATPKDIPNAPILNPGERYEAIFHLDDSASGVILQQGKITTPSPQQTASQGGDVLIGYNQSITGTIHDAVFAHFYQFRGSAGDEVTIRVERITGDLDPIVILRDALDHNLVENDDYAGTHDSFLRFTLPETDRYVIAVTRFGLRDGTTTGDYRLILEHQSE